MLQLQGIGKRYWPVRDWAVRSLDMEVRPAEVVGLVGRNGAGKTTTLRLAAGVSKLGSGQVHVDGIDLDSEKVKASRLIGWVPEVSLHDETTRVGSLVAYYGSLAGPRDPATCWNLIERWGLRPYANRRVRTLSLGMLRRLSIVTAELTTPQYFLLDEVFNGLDPEAVVDVRNWILGRRSAGCGVLLSSHNLRELAAIADRVAVLHRGQLLAILDRSEYIGRSPKALRVRSDNLDERAFHILEQFGAVARSRDGASVSGDGLDPNSVSQALVSAGYHLAGLEPESDPLEDLFLSILKEAS
jgi:ABC-type multidrug transport system ATPase subunit